MFGIPQTTAYDLNFRLFGIPVRVHPLFWVIAFLFSPLLRQNASDLRAMLFGFAGWLLAWFLTFLIHEFGHALVIQRLFGARPWIVFYGFGGLTVHEPFYRKIPGPWGKMLISFAGPGAQLLSVAALLGVFWLCGFRFEVSFVDALGPIPIPAVIPTSYPFDLASHTYLRLCYVYFLFGFIWMGVVWSALNLLPIHPLDGGQIARQLFHKFSPRSGLTNSLILSICCALTLLAFSLRAGDNFIAIFFGFFAFMNFQELQAARARRF